MTAKHLQMSLFPLVLDILPLLELHVPVCWHPPPEWMLERIEGLDILNCETVTGRIRMLQVHSSHAKEMTQIHNHTTSAAVLSYLLCKPTSNHWLQIYSFIKRIQILDSSRFRSCDFGHAMTLTSSQMGIFLCTRISPRLPRPIPALRG